YYQSLAFVFGSPGEPLQCNPVPVLLLASVVAGVRNSRSFGSLFFVGHCWCTPNAARSPCNFSSVVDNHTPEPITRRWKLSAVVYKIESVRMCRLKHTSRTVV
ncbi:unnamed protein product, partial [Ectocarpus sp. 13 AM-2016]